MNLCRPFFNPSVLLASFTLVAVGFSSSAAERFSLDSFVIAGGGGHSNPTPPQSRFAITGTIGQTIAAPVLRSSDQRYQVQPGFWQGAIVIETPGAPELRIRSGGAGLVVLSWPVHVTGFVLEETSSVTIPNNWVPTTGFTIDTPTEHTVTIPAANALKFYRLRRN